jgi:membrane protease subunit (stomatin/prohibitin family)
VVFVSKRTLLDRKWGTREPVVFRGRELGVARLWAFGSYACRVRDTPAFVNTVVGSLGQLDTDRLADLSDFYIASITPPDEALSRLDEHASMGAVADLGAYA